MLDASDGLDLRGLAVGAPDSPVLVISTVFLTLHEVLLTPVARELVAHKAVREQHQDHTELERLTAQLPAEAFCLSQRA